jgi:hypothetical protein
MDNKDSKLFQTITVGIFLTIFSGFVLFLFSFFNETFPKTQSQIKVNEIKIIRHEKNLEKIDIKLDKIYDVLLKLKHEKNQ